MDVDVQENEIDIMDEKEAVQVPVKVNEFAVQKENEDLQSKAIVVWRPPSAFIVETLRVAGEPAPVQFQNDVDIALQTAIDWVNSLDIPPIRVVREPDPDVGEKMDEPGMDGSEKIDEAVASNTSDTARDGGERFDEPVDEAVADKSDTAGEGGDIADNEVEVICIGDDEDDPELVKVHHFILTTHY